tara:strand:+ start:217 stop:414 length:198 start_codon:yes stop_codon:yes gene_type:complete
MIGEQRSGAADIMPDTYICIYISDDLTCRWMRGKGEVDSSSHPGTRKLKLLVWPWQRERGTFGVK